MFPLILTINKFITKQEIKSILSINFERSGWFWKIRLSNTRPRWQNEFIHLRINSYSLYSINFVLFSKYQFYCSYSNTNTYHSYYKLLAQYYILYKSNNFIIPIWRNQTLVVLIVSWPSTLLNHRHFPMDQFIIFSLRFSNSLERP